MGYTGAKTFSRNLFQTVGVVAPDVVPPSLVRNQLVPWFGNSADPKYSIIAWGNIKSEEDQA